MRPHSDRPGHREEPGVGQEASGVAGNRKGFAVGRAEHLGPGAREVDRAGAIAREDQLREEASALERVVDALAVERIHARGGVADGSPVSARDPRDGPAHRQQRRGDGPWLTIQFPLVADTARVVLQEFLDRHVRGPGRGGEGADPQIDVAVAEREHPSVPGLDDAVLIAEFEIGTDPLVIVPAGPDIRPCRHRVDRVAMPGPTQQATHRGPDAIGHHEGPARDATVTGPDGGHLAVVAPFHVRHAHTVQNDGTRLDSRLTQAIVEYGPAHGRAGPAVVARRPGDALFVTEPAQFEPADSDPIPRPAAEAQAVHLEHRAWGEPVAAGLVARERGGVQNRDLAAGSCQPCRGGGSGGAAAHHEHIGRSGEALGGVHAIHGGRSGVEQSPGPRPGCDSAGCERGP